MIINKIYAVYFSATGTTKKVVLGVAKTIKEIKSQINDEIIEIDFSLPAARKLFHNFEPDDLVICGVPTYAGRVPNLLLPFIQNNLKGNNTPVVPVALFGNRNVDDCLMELKVTLEDNGFISISAGAFVGEHSFSKTLGAGRPDENDMQDVKQLGIETEKIITNIKSILEVPSLNVVGEVPIRPHYKPKDRDGNYINKSILKVKPKTNDDCINCGLCAKICTMGSISQDNPKDVVGTCIKCCACVKNCPVKAKYYDDEGFLFHKNELEAIFERRAENQIFY